MLRKRTPRLISAAIATFGLTLALAACTSGSAAQDEVVVGEGTVVLDVRTPAEFAEGHLEGAQLLDFNAGELAAALPELDPAAEYLVYCRSGNRSGQAIALMEQAGFTNLTNLGSLQQAASSTGISVVTQ